jgi:hypothetical protein
MPVENSVNFLVRLKFGEHYVASLKESLRKQRFILIFAMAVIGFTVYAIIHANMLQPPDEHWTAFAEDAKPWLALMLIGLISIPLLLLNKTRRVLRGPRAKAGCQFHVTNNGVRTESTAGSFDLNWTAFVGAREQSTTFSLFLSRAQFFVIPKRCFSSNEDLVMFREIIRANVPKAKLS